MESTMEPKSKDMITGLRALADFLEANPEIQMFSGGDFVCGVKTKEKMAELARQNTPWEKKFVNDSFFIKKDFGGQITFQFYIDREKVCRLVETKEKRLEPALPAMPEREVVVTKREWICDDASILAGEENHVLGNGT